MFSFRRGERKHLFVLLFVQLSAEKRRLCSVLKSRGLVIHFTETTLRSYYNDALCSTDRTQTVKALIQRAAGSSPAGLPGAVHHLRPLLLVVGDLDVVAVGALVTVPQQQPGQKEEGGGGATYSL